MSRRDLIVVGGGPAGSTAAALAARAGLGVLLLEAGEHPRPHVGESLLPGIIPILERSGALPAVERAGFWPKTGSTLWNWGRTPRWDLWFADSDAFDQAWLVDRGRFDALLFDHAARSGAEVRSRCSAREVLREHGRVVGLRCKDRDGEKETLCSARWVIDATGQSGLLARLGAPPEPIPGLQHQAMWAHFDAANHLEAPRRHQALFIAEASQWWWCFPLGDGRTSVGVVQLDADGRRTAPRRDFDELVDSSPSLRDVLGTDARRVTEVRHERDWSYRCPVTAGPGWLAVGDAAGFIDPVLSTGVMLALHSAYHAATTVIDQLGGQSESESEALRAYRHHHAEMFGDLLRMVRFYYQQNLPREDYFWESKRILTSDERTRLRPQKAFVILTSGLVDNLALDEVRDEVDARRRARTASATPSPPPAPEHLDFLCIHLRFDDPSLPPPALDVPVRGASVFVLLEPPDPAAPTLFRTRNFHLNVIAPRYGNDPISVETLEPTLRRLHTAIDGLDDTDGISLAQLWQRRGVRLQAAARDAGPGFELVRVFGE